MILESIVTTALYAATGPSYGLTLKFLDEDIVKTNGAKCLDGTVPGYYYRIGEEPEKWKVHLRGGGWCFTDEDCAKRTETYVGTSKFLTPEIGGDDSPFGFMNTSEPHFGNWSLAFIEYCDGSSWTSNRSDSTTTGNVTVWHRGRPNLLSVFQDIDRHHNIFRTSTDVVLTGTSAGGMAEYLNGEFIRSFFSPSAKVVLLPDAGFFLFPNLTSGSYPFSYDELLSGWKIWNSEPALDPACLAAHPSAPVNCMIPKNQLPHISLPVFMMQSLYDTTQDACKTGTAGCNESIARYRTWLEGNITRSVTDKTAVFATACRQHEESCKDADWDGITVDGVTAATAFYRFYYNADYSKRFDVDWPGNPTCVNIKHGGC